jgi:uncharacterized membrane protein
MTNSLSGQAPTTRPEQAADVLSQPQTEILPPGLNDVLRTAGVDTEDPNVTKALAISLMMFRGSLPIPPPPVLEEYERISPGLTKQLIDWTDQQRQHRQAIEKKKTDGSEARMNRGQFIAAGIAVLGLALSTVLGIFGNPWVAAVMAIVSIGGPTAAVYLARTPGIAPTPPKSLGQDVVSQQSSPRDPASAA